MLKQTTPSSPGTRTSFISPYIFLPGKEIAQVEKALDQEIERLQKELVSERDLEKAKNLIEAAFIFRQDSLFAQAMLLAAMRFLSVGGRSMNTFRPSENFHRKISSGWQNATWSLRNRPWEFSSLAAPRWEILANPGGRRDDPGDSFQMNRTPFRYRSKVTTQRKEMTVNSILPRASSRSFSC